jgi:hypothetical protein
MKKKKFLLANINTEHTRKKEQPICTYICSFAFCVLCPPTIAAYELYSSLLVRYPTAEIVPDMRL